MPLFADLFSLFGVIALPALLPIAALLQLLFPGILREQWRHYQYFVRVLLAQSTLLTLQWALLKLFFWDPPWWLSDRSLYAALVVTAAVGAWRSWTSSQSASPDQIALAAPTTDQLQPSTSSRPTSLEFWAFGVLAFAGLGWIARQLAVHQVPWDHVAVVTAAAVVGFVHLLIRRAGGFTGALAKFTTERAALTTLVVVGIGVGLYVYSAEANQIAGAATDEWPTFRGNLERTGAASPSDAGPKQPKVLWKFDPEVKQGRILFYASPTVVSGQVYLGATHEVLTSYRGLLYCVNAADGRKVEGSDQPLKPGDRLWTFTGGDKLKPQFSSPTVSGGRLYVGEGFHEDKNCKLFCLDPRRADNEAWSFATASHVESDATIVGNRLYIGAGDDGLFCFDVPGGEKPTAPEKPVWQLKRHHIDTAPAVYNKRVYVGTVLGDLYQNLVALALDAETGNIWWSKPAPLPLLAAPSVSAAQNRVFFALGNGRIGESDPEPAGAVWAFNADTGDLVWETKFKNSVFASPVVVGDALIVVSRDRFCYCLSQDDGAIRWKYDLGAPTVACPVVAGGRAYVLAGNGVLHCLKVADGEKVWTFDKLRLPADAEEVCSSPTLVEGRLYVALGGTLYCIGD